MACSYELAFNRDGLELVAARIRESHRVVGCVAWLTHDGVLEALGSVPGGFDLVIMNDRCIKTRVLARYAAAGARGGVFHAFGLRTGKLRPLMHHKFLVGLDASGAPRWACTGSLNLTVHAATNFENVLVLSSPEVAGHLLAEHAAIRPRARPLRLPGI